MNEMIIYFLITLISSLVGFLIGKILTKLKFENAKGVSEKEKSVLEFEVSKLNETLKSTEITIDDLQGELRYVQKEKENLISDKTR
jgi:DNA recombination protein RmuC